MRQFLYFFVALSFCQCQNSPVATSPPTIFGVKPFLGNWIRSDYLKAIEQDSLVHKMRLKMFEYIALELTEGQDSISVGVESVNSVWDWNRDKTPGPLRSFRIKKTEKSESVLQYNNLYFNDSSFIQLVGDQLEFTLYSKNGTEQYYYTRLPSSSRGGLLAERTIQYINRYVLVGSYKLETDKGKLLSEKVEFRRDGGIEGWDNWADYQIVAYADKQKETIRRKKNRVGKYKENGFEACSVLELRDKQGFLDRMWDKRFYMEKEKGIVKLYKVHMKNFDRIRPMTGAIKEELAYTLTPVTPDFLGLAN